MLETNFFLIKFQIVIQESLIFKKLENIVFVIYIYLIPFKNLCCSKKSDINLPTNNIKFFSKSYFWNFCSFSYSINFRFFSNISNCSNLNHFTCFNNMKCSVYDSLPSYINFWQNLFAKIIVIKHALKSLVFELPSQHTSIET